MTIRQPTPDGEDSLHLDYCRCAATGDRRAARHWLFRIGMPCGLLLAIVKTIWWLSASQVTITPMVTRPPTAQTAQAQIAQMPPRVRIATERRDLYREVDRLIEDLQTAFAMPADEVQQLRQFRLTLTIDLFLGRLDDWLGQWGYRIPDSVHIRIQQTLSRWTRLQNLIAEFGDTDQPGG